MKKRVLLSAGLAAALLLAIVGIAAVYVGSERAFYWWDYFGYQYIAHGVFAQFQQSPGAALAAVQRSLANDYNAVFSLALIPFLLVLGDNRMAYEMGLAVAFLLPFVAAVGGIAAAMFPGRRFGAFWSAAFLAILTPFTWVPALRGFPDVGGAALALLAFLVYLRDTELKRWWQAPLAGLLFALAMLFRRHYGYAATAFFVAAGIQALVAFAWMLRKREPRAWRKLAARLVRLGAIGVFALAALLVLGEAFVRRVVGLDAFGLYASWFLSAFTIVEYHILAYGVLACALALGALAWGTYTGALRRPVSGFLLLFVAVALPQWALYVRTTGSHMTLHFTPAIVLGLTAAFWMSWDRAARLGRPAKLLVAGVAGMILAANTILGLTGLDFLKGSPLRPLFAANWPPLVREDYDELARLARSLREINPDGRPVFVAASSTTLNRTMLYSAERALFGWDAPTMLQNVPEVDSRDYYPLEALLLADFVVVAEPFQHHLPVEEQGIMQSVVDLFAQNRDLARDFTRLPEAFTLRDGVVVSVYRRLRPTDLDTATRTFHFIRSRTGRQPGGQLDWLGLNPAWPALVQGRPGEPHDAVIGPGTGDSPGSPALMYAPILPAQARVSGSLAALDEGCALPGLRFTVTGADGAPLAATDAALGALPGGGFDVEVGADQAQGLRLELALADAAAAGSPCRYQLSGLQVQAAQTGAACVRCGRAQ